MTYARMSYRIFGNYAKMIKKYFIDIKTNLHRANMKFTFEEYLAMTLLTVVILFFVETVMISFILALFFPILLSIILSFVISIGISAGIFFMFYTYPAAIASSRAKKINTALPFAISYLTSISSGKMSPARMFKAFAEFEEGEISEEAKNISRNIDVFGMTVHEALKREAERTPSDEFKNVLYGISTTISSGGDLTLYLRQKTEELMRNYRRMIIKYSQDLSLFVEIYLTLIITGAIFFIVLSSIMAVISGGMGTALIQTFVVFILLPLISIGFIILIKSLSPVD